MRHDESNTFEATGKRAATAAMAGLLAILAACGGTEDTEAFASDAPEDAGVAAPMADETAYGFDDIDMDGDSELDADEFHEWSEGPIFAFWSPTELIEDPDAVDQIGALDAVVFVDALYSAWDVNEDGALDEAEWDVATRVIESISDTEAAWIEFDVDDNRLIDVDEVHAQVESDAVLAAIDSNENGTVEDDEMNEWFFALFDVDESGAVSREEWRMAELYFDVPIL